MARLDSVLHVPFFILLTSVSLLALNQNFSSAAKGVNVGRGGSFLRQSCMNWTDYPNMCISTLEADPRSIGVNSITTLCRVAMEVAETRINYTSSFLYQFLVNETDPTTQTEIKACFRSYTASFELINVNAMPAFDAKNYDSAYDSMDLARGALEQCNEPNVTKYFQGRDTDVIQFTTDVLQLVDKQRSVSR